MAGWKPEILTILGHAEARAARQNHELEEAQMNGEMALQGPSRYPLAWWTHSCCLQREPTAARSGVRRALEEGTTKCAQTTEYQGHGPARGQESRVVSALCTTSKPHVLVRRVSDDKATSRVPPGTPRDEEIPGWSLQARLRARQRAREVPRGPPCRGWSPEQRRSRQKENLTRFSSADAADFGELQIGN